MNHKNKIVAVYFCASSAEVLKQFDQVTLYISLGEHVSTKLFRLYMSGSQGRVSVLGLRGSVLS